MTLVDLLLLAVAIYAACGFLFGLAFISVGAGRLDPGARGTSLPFRLILLPGSIALWPLLAVRWGFAVPEGSHP